MFTDRAKTLYYRSPTNDLTELDYTGLENQNKTISW